MPKTCENPRKHREMFCLPIFFLMWMGLMGCSPNDNSSYPVPVSTDTLTPTSTPTPLPTETSTPKPTATETMTPVAPLPAETATPLPVIPTIENSRIKILLLHETGSPEGFSNVVLRWMKAGYSILPMRSYLEGIGGIKPLPKCNWVVITDDDGLWGAEKNIFEGFEVAEKKAKSAGLEQKGTCAPTYEATMYIITNFDDFWKTRSIQDVSDDTETYGDGNGTLKHMTKGAVIEAKMNLSKHVKVDLHAWDHSRPWTRLSANELRTGIILGRNTIDELERIAQSRLDREGKNRKVISDPIHALAPPFGSFSSENRNAILGISDKLGIKAILVVDVRDSGESPDQVPPGSILPVIMRTRKP